MVFLLGLLATAVNIYILMIVIQVALSWLIAFEVVNEKNEAAQNLMTLLKKATDPAYKHLRKYIPPVGGIDLSPLVLIIGIQVVLGLLYAILT
jgi:YggT family protein